MPGGGELFIIVLIVVMLFGSKKIPELARGLGKGMREIKNATGDIQKEIRDGAREMNIPKNPLDIKQQVKDLINNEDNIEAKVEKEDKTENQEEKPIERKSGYSKRSFLSDVEVKDEDVEEKKDKPVESNSDQSSSTNTTEKPNSSEKS